jgi:hypothetical protein
MLKPSCANSPRKNSHPTNKRIVGTNRFAVLKGVVQWDFRLNADFRLNYQTTMSFRTGPEAR